MILFELECACCGGVVVMEGKMQRQGEGDEGDGERTPLHQFALVGQESQQDRAHERNEGDDGQDGVVYVHRGFIVSFGEAKNRSFVKQVRVSLVQPDGSAEDHDKQHGGCSDSQPAGVGTNVAGLNAADE